MVVVVVVKVTGDKGKGDGVYCGINGKDNIPPVTNNKIMMDGSCIFVI